VYNESPEYYVKDVLKTLERKLANLFAEPEIQKDQKKEIDPSSYAAQGLVLDDIDTTDMPLNKTLILTYSDTENDFKYKLMISISIDAGIPEKGDINMDSSMVKECGVKFKKYKNETEFIGELDREKVEISSINQDFLDNLNAELDKKYSVDNGFDIEYTDDSDNS